MKLKSFKAGDYSKTREGQNFAAGITQRHIGGQHLTQKPLTPAVVKTVKNTL